MRKERDHPSGGIELTGNRALHASQPGKPWGTPEKARNMAFIVEHDYHPGGLKGLEFWRLQRDTAQVAGVRMPHCRDTPERR